jgi:phosphatidylglycerol---prolipoprotein diacylglyceryl transferase
LHFPVSVNIGSTNITAHALLETAAIFIAFRYYLSLKKKQGDHIGNENRLFIIAAATIGAVLGARLVGSLENVPQWRASPNAWTYFWGNKTLAGGLLGGLFFVELTKKLLKEKRSSGDLFVYPLILGMIIGRIGCFTAGVSEETYGVASDLPWAMDLGDGIPRHPVTLYEIAFLIGLWLFLYLIQQKQLKEGALFKIFLISYLVFRFLLDFIKPGWRYAAGLGTIQLFCLAGLLYYLKYLLRPRTLLQTDRDAT